MNRDDTHLIISQHGRVCWSRLWPITKPRPIRWFYRHDKNPGWEELKAEDGLDIHWHYSGLGFDFYAISTKYQPAAAAPWTEESQTWSVPYWSIVIPLTTLSAWLLLDKQRATKRDESSAS